MATLISKERILSRLLTLSHSKDIEIIHQNEKGIDIVYHDFVPNKDINFRYNYIEKLTLEDISNKIYLSSLIPDEYSICKDILSSTIFNFLDKNSLITLNKIYIIEGDDDYDFIEKEMGGEAVLSLKEKDCWLGVMILEKSVCIINNKDIRKNVLALSNREGYTHYEMLEEYNYALWTTIIHELRHLLFETNIAIYDEEYPPGAELEDAIDCYSKNVWKYMYYNDYDSINLFNKCLNPK